MNSLTVSVTKDIIARSYRFGTENEMDRSEIILAEALIERIPDVFVFGTHLHHKFILPHRGSYLANH